MTFFTIQIIYSSKIRFVDVKNLEESQRIPSYIACLLTTMQDSWRFSKDSLHFYTWIRQIESLNLRISWRIFENPWESLRILEKCAKFRCFCLEILVIQRIPKNPRPLMPSSINDHGRVDCVKHTFTLWAALIRNLSTKAVKMFMMRSSLTPSISSCLIRSL